MQKSIENAVIREKEVMIGNYLDKVRDTTRPAGIQFNHSGRICTKCGHRKPMKGGTTRGGKDFVCAGCK